MGSTPRERDRKDREASTMLGMGATRINERTGAALGNGPANLVEFQPAESIPYGGVLFLLPFLLSNGLMGYREHYGERSGGYYDYSSTVLTLAFMFLCRIKNPEQLKHHAPGELGKLLGLDRIPEVKCLRGIISELTALQKAGQWNAHLARQWIESSEESIYYIDGHVQVYHGYAGNLGKKHISRQKLCLPGMTEFWVNSKEGMPYFYITGEVNEKLQEMILTRIVPEIDKIANPETGPAGGPRYTIVFDREAYSPPFFRQLLDDHRIAVITYNKNVKDRWDETGFTEHEVRTTLGPTTMKLQQRDLTVKGVSMREVRKLNDGGHQTSILTTHWDLEMAFIAGHMFARWAQENFFKYMIQEYAFDNLTQYTVNQLDGDIKVVNREYSNLTYRLKKVREKTARRKARLYNLKEQNIKEKIENTKPLMARQLRLNEELGLLAIEEKQLVSERKGVPYKIEISQMPQEYRYTKLNTESKHLMNIIKMIAYRSETALANLLAPGYSKSDNEIRALVKSLIYNRADLHPDFKENKLVVTLYSMASERENLAIERICQTLNEAEVVFPGSDLTLIYKTTTI